MQYLRNLFFIFVAILLGVSALYGFDKYNSSYGQFTKNMERYNLLISEGTRTSLVSFDALLRLIGRQLLDLGVLEKPSQGQEFINNLSELHLPMAGYGIIRTDGQILLMSGRNDTKNLPNLMQNPKAARGFQQALTAETLQVGKPYFMSKLNQWIIPNRVALKDANGEVAAMIGAGLKISGEGTIWERLINQDLYKTMLFHGDGYVQYAGVDAHSRQDLNTVYSFGLSQTLLSTVKKLSLTSKSGTLEIPKDEQYPLYQQYPEWIMAYEYLSDYDLFIITAYPYQKWLKEFYISLIPELIGAGLLLLFIFGSYRYAISRHAQDVLASANEGLELKVQRRTEDLKTALSAEKASNTLQKQAEQSLKESNTKYKVLNQELDLRVEERTHELETVVQELNSFSYSVSHDLRGPLRSLDGVSRSILDEYSDQLDEQGQGYLSRIRQDTKRMGELIDDLLRLSRLSKQVMHIEPVDVSEIAKSIRKLIIINEANRKIQFSIDEGLKIAGDESLIKIVLENLIDNAVKYTGNEETAEIVLGNEKVEGKGDENGNVFFIRDNGAGFDMDDADDLFVTFKRLHSDEEFPGSGVGLSIVEQIIKRHGGAIWADATPDQGSTFYFHF